jgi:hypothetical protein
MDPVYGGLVCILFFAIGYLAGYGRGEIDMLKRIEEERRKARYRGL